MVTSRSCTVNGVFFGYENKDEQWLELLILIGEIEIIYTSLP